MDFQTTTVSASAASSVFASTSVSASSPSASVCVSCLLPPRVPLLQVYAWSLAKTTGSRQTDERPCPLSAF